MYQSFSPSLNIASHAGQLAFSSRNVLDSRQHSGTACHNAKTAISGCSLEVFLEGQTLVLAYTQPLSDPMYLSNRP
jgi:hypothetical protein